MDDIELVLVCHRNRTADHGIPGNLFHKVGTVFSGELVGVSVMYGEITHLTPPVLFHQGVELGRVQIRNHIGTDMHELYLVQKIIYIHSISYLNRHVAGIDDLRSALVLVTRSGRHHEHRAYSAV